MDNTIALDYIRKNNLIGIKAGSERSAFLEIWMVVVNDRIFARSWGLASRSWYTCFIQNSAGQIKCGDHIFNVKGIIPLDIDQLTSDINDAYVTKYNSPHNRKYAKGIISKEHVSKTIELVIDRY